MGESDMRRELRQKQLFVKGSVAFAAGDDGGQRALRLRMARQLKIHKGKQTHRFHYIPEWATHRHMRQADIARALGVEKSTVKRWFDGSIPTNDHLLALSGFLNAGEPPEPAALFRHPDDDWMAALFRGRAQEEAKRIREMIESAVNAAFPRRAA